MSDSWSNIEVELIVADYFNMLSSELKGEAYSKAVHRRALLPLLANRSDGSVEFKHQNISAVLINLGQPYIICDKRVVVSGLNSVNPLPFSKSRFPL